MLMQCIRNSRRQLAAGGEPIDAVYTWVNGSDPDFIATIRLYDPNYDRSRFDDKNELKYSLRYGRRHRRKPTAHSLIFTQNLIFSTVHWPNMRRGSVTFTS